MDVSEALSYSYEDHFYVIDSDEEPLIERDSGVCCCSEHTDSDSDVSSCGSEHTVVWAEDVSSCGSEQTMDWVESEDDSNRVSRLTSVFESS